MTGETIATIVGTVVGSPIFLGLLYKLCKKTLGYLREVSLENQRYHLNHVAHHTDFLEPRVDKIIETQDLHTNELREIKGYLKGWADRGQ